MAAEGPGLRADRKSNGIGTTTAHNWRRPRRKARQGLRRNSMHQRMPEPPMSTIITITITIIPHHHPSSSSSTAAATSDPFLFLAHAARSALEAWAPNSCSADRACPRRNFAEIIEARRARGCGALCGHRTGLAGGNLNRACHRHNSSGVITANRARSCCALCGYVMPVQSPCLFLNWPRQRLEGAGRASGCGGSRR